MTHRRVGWARLGLATVVGLAVPLACGGSNSSALFNGGGAGANGDASAGTGGSSTGGSSTGGSSTGGSSTGGSSTGGSSTGGSSTGGSSTGGSSTGGSSTGGSSTGGSSTGGSSTGGSSTGGSSTGGTAGTAGVGGTAGTGGTGTGGTAGTGGTGTGGTAGTGGTGTGGTAGTGGTGTGGTAGTGGAGGATFSITCGNSTTCSGPSQACCVSRNTGSQTQYSCIDSGSQCKCSGTYCLSAKLSCDGPSDCPSGQVCCATLVSPQSTRFRDFTCANSCNGSGQYEVCQANDGVNCPNGTQCRQSYLSGYNVCY